MGKGMQFFIFITALALFIITVSFGEFLSNQVLGIPDAVEGTYQNSEQFAQYIKSLPPSAFLGLAIAHFIAAVVGGLVLGLGRLPAWTVWVLGGLATLAGFFNLWMLPGHPVWFWVLDLATYIPGVLLGYRWVENTRKLVAEKAVAKPSSSPAKGGRKAPRRS